MDEKNTTVESDALVVTVEMGDEFVPGPDTSRALARLVEALQVEHGDEVVGFSFEPASELRSFTFVSRPAASYNFFEAWPSKWHSPGFDGKGTD